jgi:hypothetical protein
MIQNNTTGPTTAAPPDRDERQVIDPATDASCDPSPTTQVAREVRADIERALHTRHFGHGEILFKVEDKAKTAGEKVWIVMKKRPYFGIGVVSMAGFALATATGVGELAIGVLCGYAAYEVLRRGRPVGQTVEEVVRDVGKMA